MTMNLLVRRLVTIIGVALLVIVGFAAIRVAAVWTAASAPLQISPASAASLQAAIADEQARSAALRDSLGTLAAQTEDLAAALDDAQSRLQGDTKNAHDISAQLKAAKQQLARIEAAIARARRSLANGSTTAPVAGATSGGGGSSSSGGGTGEDDGVEHEGP